MFGLRVLIREGCRTRHGLFPIWSIAKAVGRFLRPVRGQLELEYGGGAIRVVGRGGRGALPRERLGGLT